MPTLWDAIRATLSAADRVSEPRSVLTGRETDDELRDLVLHFARQCPVGEFNRYCPFYVLNSLHHETLKNIVGQMSRTSLLELFEDERQCRKEHPDKCFQLAARPAGG